MTVVVAGAAGFLGSHLVDALLADGQEVLGIDCLLTGRKQNLAHIPQNAPFRFLECDITNELPPLPVIHDVYHLASAASPIHYQRYPIETLRAGSRGTENLLELASDNRARFLLASTSEVYGDPTEHPQSEGYFGNVNPIGLRSCYDEAKRFSEALTAAYRREKDLDSVIVRIFNTYGPRMRWEDGRVIPSFVAQAIEGKAFTVFGDGTQTRSFCYVSDMIRGMRLAMENPLHGPVNLGSDEEVEIGRLAQEIAALCGTAMRVVRKELPEDDPRRRRPDTSLAREVLGWWPEVPIGRGLELTIAHFFKEKILR